MTLIASHLLRSVPVSLKKKFSYFRSSIGIYSKDKKRRKIMSCQARSASPDSLAIASNVDDEIRVDAADNESFPFLSESSVEEASIKSGTVWSASSLGPGFIWIQAGSSSLIRIPHST
jgi:hypothetical protein